MRPGKDRSALTVFLALCILGWIPDLCAVQWTWGDKRRA